MTPTVELLQALIRNGCVNDGTPGSGQEIRSVNTIAEYLGEDGTRFEPAPGRTSIVYRVPGRVPGAPRLMLMGHTDVVPVNMDGWSRDPFAGEIHDGFVWGRGAIDMLNLTAAMTTVFGRYLRGELEPPAGDLLLLAVADEENAGGLGAGPLVRDRWDLVGCEYLLTEIAYPPIRSGEEWGYPVSVSEKGPHWTTLRTTGTPGHGSVPFGSDNALAPLAEALHGLFTTASPVMISDEWRAFVEALDLDEELAAHLLDPDRVDAAIERLAAADPRFAAYVHACTHLTVSPNVISGGVKANMVADGAAAQVDLRTLPGQTRADVDDHLIKSMGSAAGRVELVPIADHVANSSAIGNPLWDAVVDGLETMTGSRRAVPTLMPATTDARFFRAKGTVAYGVGLFDTRVSFADFLSMFHGNDEKVTVESVGLTVDLLTAVLAHWTSSGGRG